MNVDKGIQGSCPYMKIANKGTTIESAKEYITENGLKPYPRLGIRHGVPSEVEAQLAEDKRLGVRLTPLSPEEATPIWVYKPNILESLFIWWGIIVARLIGLLILPFVGRFSKG